MRARAAVVVLSALSALVYQAEFRSAKGQGNEVKRFIVIGTNEAGDCTVLATPTIIRGARPGTRVAWDVINRCGSPQDVKLDNFQLMPAGGGPGSANLPLQARPQGQSPVGESTIRGVVKPQPDAGRYKYDILINDVVKDDPEIEVER